MYGYVQIQLVFVMLLSEPPKKRDVMVLVLPDMPCKLYFDELWCFIVSVVVGGESSLVSTKVQNPYLIHLYPPRGQRIVTSRSLEPSKRAAHKPS